MSEGRRSFGLLDLLTLSRTRRVLRARGGRTLAVLVALFYGLVALVVGSMLELVPTGASTLSVQTIYNPLSPEWWNYPALLLVAPEGILVLPFFASLSMLAVSIGVGIGMGAGLLVAVRVYRDWKRSRAQGRSVGSMAGLTPAMVALLTLGACCSTSFAAAAGIGAVAMASGVSIALLQVNNWYLNVFQILVLGIALIAQEGLLKLYGGLIGLGSADRRLECPATLDVVGEPRWSATLLRVVLVVVGAAWSLAFLLEVAVPPAGAPIAGVIAGGLFQHVLPGGTAVLVGLSPNSPRLLSNLRGSRTFVPVLRLVVLVAGGSLALGVPPPLTSWGMGGTLNALLAAAGLHLPEGAHVVGTGGTPSTLWVVLLAGLGAFLVVLALRPRVALGALTARLPAHAPVCRAPSSSVPGEKPPVHPMAEDGARASGVERAPSGG